MGNIDYGQVAFEAYREAVNGRDVRGKPIPTWDELKPTIRLAWWKAGVAVAFKAVIEYQTILNSTGGDNGEEN